jgi:hypothetical protein
MRRQVEEDYSLCARREGAANSLSSHFSHVHALYTRTRTQRQQISHTRAHIFAHSHARACMRSPKSMLIAPNFPRPVSRERSRRFSANLALSSEASLSRLSLPVLCRGEVAGPSLRSLPPAPTPTATVSLGTPPLPGPAAPQRRGGRRRCQGVPTPSVPAAWHQSTTFRCFAASPLIVGEAASNKLRFAGSPKAANDELRFTAPPVPLLSVTRRRLYSFCVPEVLYGPFPSDVECQCFGRRNGAGCSSIPAAKVRSASSERRTDGGGREYALTKSGRDGCSAGVNKVPRLLPAGADRRCFTPPYPIRFLSRLPARARAPREVGVQVCRVRAGPMLADLVDSREALNSI